MENDTVLSHIFDVRFEGENLLIQSDDVWGLYDLELDVVGIEPSYVSLELLCGSDDLFIAEDEDGMFGIITNLDVVQFDFEASEITNDCDSNMFEDGFYKYEDEDGYYGLLNQYGTKSTTNTYLSIGNFAEGWALVQDKTTFKYGYLTDDQYDNERYGYGTLLFDAYTFANGFASVKVEDQDQGWTALDSDGFYVSDELYYEVGVFIGGLARVKTSSFYDPIQYAYINEEGIEIFSGLSYTTEFYDGYASARLTTDNATWGMIQKEL